MAGQFVAPLASASFYFVLRIGPRESTCQNYDMVQLYIKYIRLLFQNLFHILELRVAVLICCTCRCTTY